MEWTSKAQPEAGRTQNLRLVLKKKSHTAFFFYSFPKFVFILYFLAAQAKAVLFQPASEFLPMIDEVGG